jgi:uncharacterized protein (DUF1800 family)
MKRLGYALGVAALLLAILPLPGHSAGRFDQKLSADKQIIHVLNRLTFGLRAGDVLEVRRLGLDKWIDLQLHPDRLTEPPVLDARLKPFTTLQLVTWRILEKYPLAPAALMIRPPSAAALQSLSPLQRATLTTGSRDERRTTLAALDPETRRLVLAGAPPPMLDGLPDDLQQEAAKARQAEQEALQNERRRLMPPLTDLLSPDQMRTARTGTREDKQALLDSFDADKRQQILRALGPQAFSDFPALRREALAASQPQQFVHAELMENKLYRAIYSNRQLEEVLVDFWMNHFNVFNGKGPARALLTSYERDAIRPHVFGRFRDLLTATARHPAMLFYLDNWQSQVLRDDLPFQPPPGAQRPGLNENYGRELMELHTLGVDGGYTQQDVIAVARAFTGWTIYDLNKYAEFQFNPNGHDRKEKVVLGHTLPAGRGEQDGLDVIDILARHPSTATFISKKLAQRFVADDPPAALVSSMADTFTRTDGDLRAVLQTMFGSTEFLSEGAWQTKLKSPLEMVVSAVRAVNADVEDTFALAQRIADLGEPLYGRVEPPGYPNTGEAWANTAGILGRINFGAALTAGQLPGVSVNLSRFNFKDAATVAGELLGVPPSPSTLAAIEKGIQDKEATPSILAALVMGSPDFQRR